MQMLTPRELKGIPMDNDQTDYIRHRLQSYEDSIGQTENHFDELDSFGMHRACAPWYEKSGICLLISALPSDDDTGNMFWQDYDRITAKLHASVVLNGPVCREMLYTDLKNYVAAYHAVLCYADLGLIPVKSDHDLFNREAIRALLAELSADYDTGDIENLVTTLDDLLLHMRNAAGESPSEKMPVPKNAGDTPLSAGNEYGVSWKKRGQTRLV
jgi:hypothetical protein